MGFLLVFYRSTLPYRVCRAVAVAVARYLRVPAEIEIYFRICKNVVARTYIHNYICTYIHIFK